MELKTYRYRGHSMSDPAKYRSREEVQAVRDKSDSIEHLKKLMTDAGISEDMFKAIDKEIRAIVAESADFAASAPEPALHEQIGRAHVCTPDTNEQLVCRFLLDK